MKRIATGIKNLDNLLEGGFEEKGLFLVMGRTGTCKSTFGMQFLVEGAKNGERGLYVSFEENPDSVKRTALRFGWDLDRLGVVVKKIAPYDYYRAVESMIKEIMFERPERVVIDSITNLMIYRSRPEWKGRYGVIELYTPTLADIRMSLFGLLERLRALGATYLLIAEEGVEGLDVVSHVSSLIADGIIRLGVEKIAGNEIRTLQVVKMRRTKHPLERMVLLLKDNGLDVVKAEDYFQ